MHVAVAATFIGLSWACASTGGVPKPFPMPPAPAGGGGTSVVPAGLPGSIPPLPRVVPPERLAVVGTALDLQGVQYVYGGSDPDGFDCSGFTQYVFAQHDMPLPREVRDQFRVGRAVGRGDVRPGDLLFFTTTAPGASHVAISLGGDEFVHAPSSTGVVRVERLTTPYWSRRFLGARRVG